MNLFPNDDRADVFGNVLFPEYDNGETFRLQVADFVEKVGWMSVFDIRFGEERTTCLRIWRGGVKRVVLRASVVYRLMPFDLSAVVLASVWPTVSGFGRWRRAGTRRWLHAVPGDGGARA